MVLREQEKVVPSEIKNDAFIIDLKRLINGEEIIDPWGRVLRPAKYIILEEPYGRLRTGMSELIDYSVCIDIPLEISLCRRIIRNITYDYKHDSAEDRMNKILKYVMDYNNVEGKAIKYLYDMIKEKSDIKLDGLKPKEVLVKELVEFCHKK